MLSKELIMKYRTWSTKTKKLKMNIFARWENLAKTLGKATMKSKY